MIITVLVVGGVPVVAVCCNDIYIMTVLAGSPWSRLAVVPGGWQCRLAVVEGETVSVSVCGHSQSWRDRRACSESDVELSHGQSVTLCDII